jgi:hypothetical protein
MRVQVMVVNSQAAFAAVDVAARPALYKPQIAEVSAVATIKLVNRLLITIHCYSYRQFCVLAAKYRSRCCCCHRLVAVLD